MGDCREKLRELEDSCVQMCVTSPPYWGLRDYGTATWVGGDPECPHMRTTKISKERAAGWSYYNNMFDQGHVVGDAIYKNRCPKCGAERRDSQLGLEETPEEYVKNMVEVFREVRRVLRSDGTLWLNLGDTYCGTGHKGDTKDRINGEGRNGQRIAINNKVQGLKQKDLIGIPWRVAFALQADGWYLRQDIIWHKPNPMPESVKDRCTKSHEYIFLMSKSPKYYYDYEAIKERAQNWGTRDRSNGKYTSGDVPISGGAHGGLKGKEWEDQPTKNKRSVWSVATKPYKGAHFAVFPTELITRCILAGSKEGDTVLDPFFGSGTTGYVCESLNREWIGVELNNDYVPLQKERINQKGMKFG